MTAKKNPKQDSSLMESTLIKVQICQRAPLLWDRQADTHCAQRPDRSDMIYDFFLQPLRNGKMCGLK